MSVSRLVPWNRARNELNRSGARGPLSALQDDLRLLFHSVWNGFDLSIVHNFIGLETGWPVFQADTPTCSSRRPRRFHPSGLFHDPGEGFRQLFDLGSVLAFQGYAHH